MMIPSFQLSGFEFLLDQTDRHQVLMLLLLVIAALIPNRRQLPKWTRRIRFILFLSSNLLMEFFQHVNLHKYKLNQHKVCISSWFTSSNILNRKHKIRDLLGFQKSSRKKEKLSAGGCDHRYFFFSLFLKKGGQLYTIPLVTLGWWWWCPIRAEEAGSWPFLPLRAAAAC